MAIVIPAYKETFLRQTLESIANQTDKRFHLYVGDDCSPYDLGSIVNEFEDRIALTYKRFDTNLGGKDLVAQWERCIAMSEDEPYIWLFSDDDIMGEECVETFLSQTEEIKQNSLCHFDIKMIDDKNGGEIVDRPRFPHSLKAGEYLEGKLRGQIVSYVMEFIFPRWLYEKVKGFQNFDLAWGSDFMTWLKMAANCDNGIVTITRNEDSMVYWRQSYENISPNRSLPIMIRKMDALIEMATFIKNEMKRHPDKYLPIKYSFRWVRFPLRGIYRNRKILKNDNIKKLIANYISKVGFKIPARFAELLCKIP